MSSFKHKERLTPEQEIFRKKPFLALLPKDDPRVVAEFRKYGLLPQEEKPAKPQAQLSQPAQTPQPVVKGPQDFDKEKLERLLSPGSGLLKAVEAATGPENYNRGVQKILDYMHRNARDRAENVAFAFASQLYEAQRFLSDGWDRKDIVVRLRDEIIKQIMSREENPQVLAFPRRF